jgi:HSP90 family molecular chaperone
LRKRRLSGTLPEDSILLAVGAGGNLGTVDKLTCSAPLRSAPLKTCSSRSRSFFFVIAFPIKTPFSFADSLQMDGARRERMRILENCEDLIPKYQNFTNYVADSENLPLILSHKMTLQQNKILKVISKNLVKKCMEMFEELTEDEFHQQIDKNLKLGIHENNTNSKLQASSSKQSAYKDEQSEVSNKTKQVIFSFGESTVTSSAFVERQRKQGLDVIYMLEFVH